MKYTEVNGKNLSQMTLGTVQLGMNYGIANTGGQPDSEKSFNMLSCAIGNGITSLDTARAYGNSEDVLGGFLKENNALEKPFLTSKLIIGLPTGASEQEVEKAMYASLETSLEKLGISKLDCLMLHRANEMTKYGNAVPHIFEKLIAHGYISMAGVSVYQPEELDEMLENEIYTATQIPMSLFDQKLIHKGYLDRLKEKNITVFVRSVFLQGLFFLEPDKITDTILVEYAKPYLEKLHIFCNRANMTTAEFAISFIRDIPGVTSLVLGADNEEQVLKNIGYMNAPPLSEQMREDIYESFKGVNLNKIMEVLSRSKQ